MKDCVLDLISTKDMASLGVGVTKLKMLANEEKTARYQHVVDQLAAQPVVDAWRTAVRKQSEYLKDGNKAALAELIKFKTHPELIRLKAFEMQVAELQKIERAETNKRKRQAFEDLMEMGVTKTSIIEKRAKAISEAVNAIIHGGREGNVDEADKEAKLNLIQQYAEEILEAANTAEENEFQSKRTKL
jgi:hypothetical protein